MIEKQQLLTLVHSDAKTQALLHLSEEELCVLFGAAFAGMKDYAQNNPHHCYDLLTHAVHVALGIDDTGIPKTDFEVLRIAALWHDVGKPFVAAEKAGRTVYYNHAYHSALIAAPALERIGFSAAEAGRICFFIQNHDLFIDFKLPEEISDTFAGRAINEKNVYRAVNTAKKSAYENGNYIPTEFDFLLLTRLSHADYAAQSEKAIYGGVVKDTKTNKLKRIEAIYRILAAQEK